MLSFVVLLGVVLAVVTLSADITRAAGESTKCPNQIDDPVWWTIAREPYVDDVGNVALSIWVNTCNSPTFSGGLAHAIVNGDFGQSVPIQIGTPTFQVKEENGRRSWITEMSIAAKSLVNGELRFLIGGFKVGSYVSPIREEFNCSPICRPLSLKYVVNPPTTTTTAPPPPPAKIYVAEDSVSTTSDVGTGYVFRYRAVVRCSKACGKLPAHINARLCRDGAGYQSPYCTAPVPLAQLNAKSRVVTVSGTDYRENTFLGSFNLGKKPNGRTYRVYLYPITGVKETSAPTLRGVTTVMWLKFPNFSTTTTTSSTVASAPVSSVPSSVSSTTGPIVSTTLPPPVANVVTDWIAGSTNSTVIGKNVSVAYAAVIGCGSTCSTFNALVTVRLCKTGTSYSDKSCLSATRISLAGEYGSSAKLYKGQVVLPLGPGGTTYQAYLLLDIAGVNGSLYRNGTATMVWRL